MSRVRLSGGLPATLEEVDSSGLLGFLYCGPCGRLLHKYWGTLL